MRRYTLAQLEALRCIVTLGTFQAAADHLNVTQPTISLRIRELESIIGYDLLRRNSGRGELTAEGSVFYQYVDRLTRTLNEMDRRLRTRDPLQGVLRLGVCDTFAISCLPELLSKLDEAYPDLRVELTIRESSGLAELLNARVLDLAFLADAPLDPDICVRPLADCHMAWFGYLADHSMTDPLTPAHLARQRLLTLPVNRVLNTLMLRWFEASNQPNPTISTCNSLAMVLRLTNAGHAWSILPICFALSNGTRILPAPIKVGPDLPAIKLRSAYRTEGKVDTLSPVVDMARDIIMHMPGISPGD